jgi:hypothetical protein
LVLPLSRAWLRVSRESGPEEEKSMFTQYAKKLYFNIQWAPGTTLSAKFIPCTPFRPSVTLGDRYGALLQALPALTGNSPNTNKERQSVTAVYVPRFAGVANPTSGPGLGESPVYVDFCAPTLAFVPGTNIFRVPLLPYLSADGTTVNRNLGTDTIYGTLGQPRHFSVRLRRNVANIISMGGVLYVGRNHSIEV